MIPENVFDLPVVRQSLIFSSMDGKVKKPVSCPNGCQEDNRPVLPLSALTMTFVMAKGGMMTVARVTFDCRCVQWYRC